MIDENYHIEDIDDIFDSQNEPVKEAAAKTEPVKARIIFEDSTSNQAKRKSLKMLILKPMKRVTMARKDQKNQVVKRESH